MGFSWSGDFFSQINPDSVITSFSHCSFTLSFFLPVPSCFSFILTDFVFCSHFPCILSPFCSFISTSSTFCPHFHLYPLFPHVLLSFPSFCLTQFCPHILPVPPLLPLFWPHFLPVPSSLHSVPTSLIFVSTSFVCPCFLCDLHSLPAFCPHFLLSPLPSFSV